jgi:paraquat-inducible protein B
MSEATPPAGAAEAVIESRRRPSIVWLIPLVAALAGAFIAWRTISERGPAITIRFESAEGLEAGKTSIKYKDVEVGLVEEVTLAADLSDVIVRARMVKGAEAYLTEKTRFWVVRPRVAGGQVTGLGTLLSGAYIGMDPVREAKSARKFRGLEVPPIVTTGEPGRHFTLRSRRGGSIEVGTPVYFRKVQVGRVIASGLDPSDDFVSVRVFVDAPHHDRVRENTRFWDASGFDATISAEGVSIDTESMISILVGGIGFDTPDSGDAAPVAEEGAVFPLYQNFAATTREIYQIKVPYLLHFENQSVAGLHAGSPVEFEGIPIGEVRDVRLVVDPESGRFRVPVLIDIEPERIGNVGSVKSRREMLDRLVALGLRAQLKSGNLLTGAQVVSLEMKEDAAPAQIVWDAPVPEFPTVPTPLEEIQASLTRLVQKLERVPLDEIAADLRGTLVSVEDTLAVARGTLTEAERALDTAGGAIAPGSPIYHELQRSLIELGDAARSLGLAADQIEEQPDSLIFGRGDR